MVPMRYGNYARRALPTHLSFGGEQQGGAESERIVLSQSGNIFLVPNAGNVTIGDSVAPAAEEQLNVNGGILLKDDGVNWGDLQVQYDAGTQGYYAVYAP